MDNNKGLIVDYGHLVVVYRKTSGELSCRLERAARELASKNYEDGDKEVGLVRISDWIDALNSFHWVEVNSIDVKPGKNGDYEITWQGVRVKPEERKSEETLTIFDEEKDIVITKKISKRFHGYGDYNDYCPSWRAKEEILETVDVSENHKSVSEKIKSLPKPGKNGLVWDKEVAPVKSKTKDTGKYFLAMRNEEVRLLQYVTEKTVYGPYSVYTEEQPCKDNGWKWTIRKHKFNAKTISVKTPTLVRSISSDVLIDKLVSDKEISELIIKKIK